jgi:hypothetical protein
LAIATFASKGKEKKRKSIGESIMGIFGKSK